MSCGREDGAMLIESARIRAVGRRADLPIPAEAEILDAGGRVVMPGFVDAHTHPVFAGDGADEFELRITGVSYKEIAERGGGIRSTVRRTRLATEQDRLRVEDELKLLRVISRLKPIRCVPTFLGAHETPEECRGRKRDYVDLVVRRSCPRWRASSSPNTATYFASEAFSISMALVGFSMRRDPPVSVCECTPTSSLMLAAGG